MSISKYAFLALMACASPALAADITPDSSFGPGLSITAPEGVHVNTSGDCPPRQIPLPTPRGVAPTESQCLITVTQDETPAPATVAAPPATTTQLNQKFYFTWSGNNASGGMKAEGTPSGEIQLFPSAVPQTKQPVTSDAQSGLNADRLGHDVVSPPVAVISPVPEQVPDLPASPVYPVEKAPLPDPQIAVLVPALPAQLVPVPVIIPDPPFTPEGIYQECSQSPYYFTEDQANINYARFRDAEGYNPGRVRFYWDLHLYSNACWVMKTY